MVPLMEPFNEVIIIFNPCWLSELNLAVILKGTNVSKIISKASKAKITMKIVKRRFNNKFILLPPTLI
jgi:hypothetical protein